MYLSVYLTKTYQKNEIFIKYSVQNMDLGLLDPPQVDQEGQGLRKP